MENALEISEFEDGVASDETFGLIKRLEDDTEEVRTHFFFNFVIL